MKDNPRYELRPYGSDGHTQVFDTQKDEFFGGVGFREHEQELAKQICEQWNNEEARQRFLALKNDIFALVTMLTPSIRTWAQFYETPIGVACKKKNVRVMQRFVDNHRKSGENNLLRSWISSYIQAITPDNRNDTEDKAFVASALEWELGRLQAFYSQIEAEGFGHRADADESAAIKAEIEAITTALTLRQQYLEVENAKRQAV